MAQQAPRPSARESVVAYVDDKPITTYDIRQRVTWLLIVTGTQPTEENVQALQREAQQALIDERLQENELRNQAIARNLEPDSFFATEEAIDSYIENLAQDNGLTPTQFLAELNARGLSNRTVRRQLQIVISWEEFTRGYYGRMIRVSDDRVNSVMREITATAAEPRYLLNEIFLGNDRPGGAQAAAQAAQTILAQLRQQGRFEPLARQFSGLPSASNGGDTGWMTSAQLRPEVLTVLQQLRPGQVSSPIQTPDGIFIIYLRDKRDGGGATVVSLKQVAAPLASTADAATIQAAQTQLLAVKGQLNGCTGLEQVAQTAGLTAGDLGQANLEDLNPAFREAVSNLQPNQVSNPIRTETAMHIVALCARTVAGGPELPSRDEVAYQLREEEIAMIQRRELRNLRSTAIIAAPQQR